MTRTYWLSFVDPDRPAGSRFLGGAYVDVDEADVAAAAPFLASMRRARLCDLPPASVDQAWLAGAIRKAWATGCNPGGEVAAVRVDDHSDFPARAATLPRHRLLSMDEIAAAAHAAVEEELGG